AGVDDRRRDRAQPGHGAVSRLDGRLAQEVHDLAGDGTPVDAALRLQLHRRRTQNHGGLLSQPGRAESRPEDAGDDAANGDARSTTLTAALRGAQETDVGARRGAAEEGGR